MDTGAHNFIATTRHDILSTEIFLELISANNRRYKIDKVNMHLSTLSSTESSTMSLSVKFLPGLSFYLDMLQ